MAAVVSVFGVEPLRIGGNESFARELSLQLGRHGFRSVLCFLKEPPEDVRRFLDLPNVSIEVLAESWYPNRRAITGLTKILRAHRPQVLHLHFVGFLGCYPWLGRLLSVEQIFFTDQTSYPAGYVRHRAPYWKRRLMRVINRPLSKVIGVSNYNHQCMTTLDLVPAERCEMIYNSVDFSRIAQNGRLASDFRRKYAIPEDRVMVAQVCWMIPEKGITDLLNAARLVVSQNDKVHFVLVGEGKYRAEYMQLAQEMGLSDHITWTGLIQDPFAEGVYDAADILCQVSRWEEAFGWVIAEAMTYKKPVVATRVGGIPEVVEDRRSGFLVAREDSNAIAEKILLLANDRNLRERMGQAGYQIARDKFDLEKNVARLLNLYGIPAKHAASAPSLKRSLTGNARAQ